MAASRERLIETVDSYLDALAANDPSRLKLAPGARYTENGQQLGFGRGIWRTSTGREKGGSYVADASTGQACFLGAANEAGSAVVLALRLRLVDGAISEAESLVVRQSRIMDAAAIVTPRSLYATSVEPAQRSPREDLIKVANSYLEAIEQHDAGLVAVRDDCIRIENGVQTILNEDWPSEAFRMGVAEQIRSGNVSHIAAVRERRFPAVDEERGLVFAIFFFDHPGRAAGAADASPFKFPNSMMAFELFKIAAGEIVQIEAIADVFPYGMKSGWSE